MHALSERLPPSLLAPFPAFIPFYSFPLPFPLPFSSLPLEVGPTPLLFPLPPRPFPLSLLPVRPLLSPPLPLEVDPLLRLVDLGDRFRGGATPGPGRSYALPLKNWDLALGPACDILF